MRVDEHDSRRAYFFKDSDDRSAFLASIVICVEAVFGDVEVQGRECDVRKVDDGIDDCVA